MFDLFTENTLPTVAEVCEQLGLQDVEITYEDDDYRELQTYKYFQQHCRPLIQKENPKVNRDYYLYDYHLK